MNANTMCSDSSNNDSSVKQIVANTSSPENSINGEAVTENEKISVISRVGTCFFKLRLEIFAFLFTFSSDLVKITSTTMIMRKVCLVHLKFNSSICDNLENYSDIKDSVVKLATNYQLGHSLIHTAPAAVLACFIGPWSDHYGRKLPILLALSGMFIDSIGSSICAYFLDSKVEYYFIPPLFTGLSGGGVTVMAIVYTYCSDSTTLFGRTMKYAFIEMSVGFATSFGKTAGGWIYKGLGFTPVFLFKTGGLLITFIFAIFMIIETRGLDNNDPWSSKVRNLFSCKMLSESFTAIIKYRPDGGRRQVVLLIVSICFLIIARDSTGDINYLYAHHQFGWDDTTYSNITSIYSIGGIVVLVIIIPLLIHFRIKDPYLGLLGTASLLAKCLGIGLLRNIPVYHIANVIGFLGGCATFAARSRISKIARDDDVGKLFTFVATAENFLPILTSVLISQLFIVCLSFFPGMPYVALGIFLLLPLGVFSWMIFLPKLTN